MEQVGDDVGDDLRVSVVGHTPRFGAFGVVMVYERHTGRSTLCVLEIRRLRDCEPGHDGTVRLDCAVLQVGIVKRLRGEGGDGGVHAILRVEHDGWDV